MIKSRIGKKKYIQNVIEVEPVKQTQRQRVYNAIRASEDGLTPQEILMKTSINERRIREATGFLIMEERIKSNRCRCGHAPIYYT